MRRVGDFFLRTYGGFQDRCRTCYTEKDKAHYIANKAAINARNNAYIAGPGRGQNIENCKARYSANKEEYNARSKAWALKNADKKKRDDAAYFRANRAKSYAAREAFHRRHPDWLRASNKKYREANRDLMRSKEARRRLHIGARSMTFTKQELRARLSVFGGLCAYCGAPAQQIDHVKAIANLGYHMLANLRPACQRCNGRKSNKPWKQWLASLPASTSVPVP